MTQLNISDIFLDHQSVITSLQPLIPQIEKVGNQMISCLKRNGKILFLGNGGSAADAQHLAAELVVRFTRERRGLAAIALTTDTSILTAAANDYNFNMIFARQIEALCKSEDLVFGISTSGNSLNVLNAFKSAKKTGALTIGFTGNKGGELVNHADDCLIIPATNTARIQEAQILVGHILCDMVEAAMQEAED